MTQLGKQMRMLVARGNCLQGLQATPRCLVTWLPQGLIGSVFQSIWNTLAVHYCARHTDWQILS